MRVTCACGAIYQRTETRLPGPGQGSHHCVNCDRLLEAWDGPVLPSYQLLQMPAPTSGEQESDSH